MATSVNAPYKISQRRAESHIKYPGYAFVSVGLFGGPGKTARAIRSGKHNKKSSRRLATGYR